MKSNFTICNTEFTFDLMDTSKAFRMNVNNLNKLIDLNSMTVIKLSKSKGHLKLCNKSNKSTRVDILPYLKSNYEFMSQIMECIDIIKNNYKPRSLDYSDLTGNSDDVILNNEPRCTKDVILKWTWNTPWNKDSILITIF